MLWRRGGAISQEGMGSVTAMLVIGCLTPSLRRTKTNVAHHSHALKKAHGVSRDLLLSYPFLVSISALPERAVSGGGLKNIAVLFSSFLPTI